MASSLKKEKTVDEMMDELLAKHRAKVERDQKRIDELEERNAHLADEISSSLTVPASAFGMSFVRAYYGETSSVCGIPIDAAVGLVLKGLAALLGFSPIKGARTAAKVVHDVANGALASWTAAMGAELGAKKRMEKPVPVPLPNMGAQEMPKFGPGPLTHEDLAAIKAAMALNTQPAMPERPHVPAPLPAPALAPMPVPNPVQRTMSPSPRTKVAAAKATAPQPSMPPESPTYAQQTPAVASAKTEAAPVTAPQKTYRFTHRWAVDPEADMRALLQSVGAPADPNTVNHLLSHENPGEEFKVILRRARAPA